MLHVLACTVNFIQVAPICNAFSFGFLCFFFFRDILQLRNMLSEMNRSVDIKPWTIEPLSEFSLNRSKSQSSLGDATSLIAFVSAL